MGAIGLLDSVAADTIVCRIPPRGESLSLPSEEGMRWRAGDFDDDLAVDDNRYDMKKTLVTVAEQRIRFRFSHSLNMDQLPDSMMGVTRNRGFTNCFRRQLLLRKTPPVVSVLFLCPDKECSLTVNRYDVSTGISYHLHDNIVATALREKTLRTPNIKSWYYPNESGQGKKLP